ncbi:MAG: cation:proton antiporter [Gammaproteobacteria bacterium]
MEHYSHVAELVAGLSLLLILASGIVVLARYLRLPFTIVLVLAGVVLAQLAPHLPPAAARLIDFHISPDIIFYVFLPSLIFESAFHLDARQLRDNLLPVLTLAVPGLLISTVVIAALVAGLTEVPFAAALVLGAILSATDPVAVIALFHQLGAPQRLTILVEGESLFNDATAIVAAKILLTVAIAGYFTPATAGSAVIQFALVFVGGIAVGWILALIAGFALGAVHENQAIEISVLTTLAYLSFLVAEEFFHVSGVMATVAAGLTMGGWGRSKISPGIADYIEHFWAYIAFVANALIFLLVGLAIDFAALLSFVDVLAVAIVAMLISRALVIYTLVPAVGRLPGADRVSRSYQTVMFWGGLRGAVALAVVLSLGDFVWAEAFAAVVMGAVLFTLVVQGLSIEPLMRRFGLDKPAIADRLAVDEVRAEAVRKAVGQIPALGSGGLFSAAIAARLEAERQHEIDDIHRSINAMRKDAFTDSEAERNLCLRCLATERIAYFELFSEHHIDEHAYRSLDHATRHRIDQLRHQGLQSALFADSPSSTTEQWLRRFYSHVPGQLGQFLQSRRVAQEYVKTWAEFQACLRVDASLVEKQSAGTLETQLMATVSQAYATRRDEARARLDDWAEQFPEFVKAMQERLAERLLMNVEYDEIAKQVDSGLVPHGLGDGLLESMKERIREFRTPTYSDLEVEPVEMLRQVPFFSELEGDDVELVVKLLKSRTVAPGEMLIREGEPGHTMFFIARGVVRVERQGQDDARQLATLLAGDFFGEMALLSDAPRSATCRATTACALYELSRSDVNAVIAQCPALGISLTRAAAERLAAQSTKT